MMGWSTITLDRDPSWDITRGESDNPHVLLHRGSWGEPLVVRVSGFAAVIPWEVIANLVANAVIDRRISELEQMEPIEILTGAVK